MLEQKPAVADFTREETLRPVLPLAPILSTPATPQDSLFVKYYSQPAWKTSEFYFLQHIIIVYIGCPVNGERLLEGKLLKGTYTSGKIGIFPAHTPQTISWDREAEFISLCFNPKRLAYFVDESGDSDRYEMIPQFALDDALIYGIGLALKTELESNRLSDRLYTESAATMLAVHLLRHYATEKYTIRQVSGGLPKFKLKTVTDYINNYLDKNLSLVELAALVQMSPNYFTRLFKQSTGFTPHQYVLNCRINRAKQLLAQQNLTLAEISLQVGFYDQSRFTSTFRKSVGLTPKKYRDGL